MKNFVIGFWASLPLPVYTSCLSSVDHSSTIESWLTDNALELCASPTRNVKRVFELKLQSHYKFFLILGSDLGSFFCRMFFRLARKGLEGDR